LFKAGYKKDDPPSANSTDQKGTDMNDYTMLHAFFASPHETNSFQLASPAGQCVIEMVSRS